MQDRRSARMVLSAVCEAVQMGLYVLIWIALPCTAWCSWHLLNLWRNPSRQGTIARAREETKMLLDQIFWIAHELYDVFNGRLALED